MAVPIDEMAAPIGKFAFEVVELVVPGDALPITIDERGVPGGVMGIETTPGLLCRKPPMFGACAGCAMPGEVLHNAG